MRSEIATKKRRISYRISESNKENDRKRQKMDVAEIHEEMTYKTSRNRHNKTSSTKQSTQVRQTAPRVCVPCSSSINLKFLRVGHNTIKENDGKTVQQNVQDIIAFEGTVSQLEILNEECQSKLTDLRNHIAKLDDCANDEGDPEIAEEVELHRQKLSRTLRELRRANIATMLEMEKVDKQELFTNPQTELSHRNSTKHSRSSLISQQDSVTEKMIPIPIPIHLSETTQDSTMTDQPLVAPSANVGGTSDEVQETAEPLSKPDNCFAKILLFLLYLFLIGFELYVLTLETLNFDSVL